ncbi:MAG: LLM class flavin-dependent oxidoreductase [Candidatus Heimdallarchaeota archaeon]
MPDIKFGNYIPAPAFKLPTILKSVKSAEEAGFDSIWIADHLAMIPVGYCPEVWSILGGLALSTKSVILGTGVTDPHRRHPALLAQSIATLDQMSQGRMVLGIGPGEAMNLDPYRIPWDKPVARIVEVITILRKLWVEQSVSFDGKFFRLKNAALFIDPLFRKKIPIYIAGNSPRTRQITGEIGDGWFPLNESPELYKKHAEEVAQSAQRVGRSPTDLDYALMTYTAIANDIENALKRVEFTRMIFATDTRKLEEGYDLRLKEDLNISQATPSSEFFGKLQNVADKITDEIITDFTIIGTVEDVIEKIDQFLKAGVTHLVMLNRGPDVQHVYKTFSELIIPYFKEQ